MNTYIIEQWYDRHSKSWITQVKNIEGNELECSYDGNRDDARITAKSFSIQYGLTLLNKPYKKPEDVKKGLITWIVAE